jgi:predicted DCC family thiol-disulfide oxidoreductase YuxK
MTEIVAGATESTEPESSAAGRLDNHLARGGALVFFDGPCDLCNASVRFVANRDPNGHFAFAPLQSPEAAGVLAARGCDALLVDPASLLLVEGDRVYSRSAAVLRVAFHLNRAWPILAVFLMVPRPLRDAVYDWVARHRRGSWRR